MSLILSKRKCIITQIKITTTLRTTKNAQDADSDKSISSFTWCYFATWSTFNSRQSSLVQEVLNKRQCISKDIMTLPSNSLVLSLKIGNV